MNLSIALTTWMLAGLALTAGAQTRSLDAAVAGHVLNEAAQVPEPHLAQGQQWTYRRLDLWRNEEVERFSQTLLSAEPSYWAVRWHILTSQKKERVGSVTGETLFIDTHGFDDPRMMGRHESLRFPLVVGKSWTFGYKFFSKPDSVTEIAQTAKVKGWEVLTVPAGRFQVLRVEHEGRYTTSEGGSRWSGRIQEIFWYAPSVRRVVAHEYQDTTGSGAAWDRWRDELVSGVYK